MLRRLAYVSYPAADLPPTEVSRIIQVSRSNNAAHGITGVLVYTGTDFAQLIEGRPDTVEQLWRNVKADRRHRDITSFLDEPTDRPWFETWRMGYLYDDTLCQQIAEWRALKRASRTSSAMPFAPLLASADAF